MTTKKVKTQLFCHYCKGSLRIRQEIRQQAHNSCNKEVKSYYPFESVFNWKKILLQFNEDISFDSYFWLDYIDGRIIAKIPEITYMSFDRPSNSLEYLLDCINQLINLETQNIQSFQLKTISPSIEELSNLKELTLGSSKLEFPDTIGNLSNLTRLELNNNYLLSIPKTIGNLSNLTRLELNHNHIKCLPDSIGNLFNLDYLELSKIELKSLPDSICQLKNLQKIELIFNQLSELPSSIENLTNITYLFLNHNKFTSLLNFWSQLESVELLTLQNNNLTSLPDSFGDLAKLNELHLDDNKLSSSPNSFGRLETNFISITNTSLFSLSDSFGNLKYLYELCLENANLSNLPTYFQDLLNLRILDLTSNNFKILPDKINYLSNSEKLNMEYNELTELLPFIENVTFQWISLKTRKIETIPDSIGNLRSLTYLYIGENPISDSPDGITNLQCSQALAINNTLIKELPEFLKILQNLQIIALFNVPLKSLPTTLEEIKSLEWIGLNDNSKLYIPRNLEDKIYFTKYNAPLHFKQAKEGISKEKSKFSKSTRI